MKSTRRNFMQLLGGAACTSALPASAKPAAPAQRPNVVFVYADDLGKGMLSHFGQKHFTTPNIDRLFREGADFTFAPGCMYCAPSRASLLTGFHDAHRQCPWIISRPGTDPKKIDACDILLPDGERYLPDIFRSRGYVTANIGKLGYGFRSTERRMARFGWDTYYGYLDHAACHGYYPPFLFRKPEDGPMVREKIPGNTHPNGAVSPQNETYGKRLIRWNTAGKKTYAPDLMIAEAGKFLDRRAADGKPFFLMYSTTLPHGPVQIPASDRRYTGFGATPDTYWPAIDPEVLRLNRRLCYWDDATGNPVTPMPKYDAEGLTDLEMEYATMIRRLDRDVGRLLDGLEARGMLGNTLFLFASDNGHEHYISQTYGKRCIAGRRDPGCAADTHDVFNGNTGMRGLKWNNFQGGVCIPLAARWPGNIAPGTKIGDLVAMYDLVPTFAELLQVPLPKRDGQSLLPLIRGGHFPPDRAVWTAGRHTAVTLNSGWKYRGGELYNLRTDPGERVNRAAEAPERARAMAQRVTALAPRSPIAH